MADRRVERTRKDKDRDITALCGDWGTRVKNDAIRDIDSDLHTYYVDRAGHRTDVGVVKDPDGPYLRTTADATSKNNLDNLPDC